MIRLAFFLILTVILASCSSGRGTLAELRQVEIVIEEENTDASLDKAIESYEKFLEKTDQTKLTPDAIRRLADLKVEKEYGVIADVPKSEAGKSGLTPPAGEAKPSKPVRSKKSTKPGKSALKSLKAEKVENDARFEDRTTVATKVEREAGNGELPRMVDLERVGAQEAIKLYRKLLDDFPDYERNDQVLYQLSRAYEEQGQIKKALRVMNRLVTDFPDSPHIDQVQFRRAEYFFSRREYSEAGNAYRSVVATGDESDYYALALYKLGWSYYKQDNYIEALHNFIALLDFKVANNVDLENITDDQERKRVKDTFRIISQSFSNLGGVDAVVDYFSRQGSRKYEDVVYANLSDYYFSKQRYNDAVSTYTSFVERNPSHRQAPLFSLRVIEINQESGFGSLVVKAKTEYAETYAFGANYWKYFSPDDRPEVVAGLKANLVDLASHYHALYQNKRFVKKKPQNLKKALYWYREFLSSFPRAAETLAMNYQLAELLLENNLFDEAAREYEKIAFDSPVFDKADKAGYASVYAYRQHLKQVAEEDKKQVNRDVIRVSLKFAEFYPEHEKAAIVLAAAVDELYALKDYKNALIAAGDLLEHFPKVKKDIRRSALLVVAHSSFELESYSEAEAAYTQVLQLLPKRDKSRKALTDNLVASIYKQGEAENRRKNYKKAAEHFLRVATVAPKSKLRSTADYDGVVALMQVEEWQGAATVLTSFRKNYPKHKLQSEVTKKLAFIYREDNKYALAAVEFERIEAESKDPALRQEALLTAAELYERVNNLDRAAKVYQRYIKRFTKPFDVSIEVRDKLAGNLKKQDKQEQYFDELQKLVTLEAAGGSGRTDQTRYIAGSAALVLAKRDYDLTVAVRLVKPFKKNLQRKQALMKKATEFYLKLFDYEIGDISAEATFYLAEIYADFSSALLKSERPEGLSALELEQYELALEEQAYPFEEKAIEMHQSNLELMSRGIYNDWVDKSLAKLAVFMPARYDKHEVQNKQIAALPEFRFENISLRPHSRVNAEPAAATDKVGAGKK